VLPQSLVLPSVLQSKYFVDDLLWACLIPTWIHPRSQLRFFFCLEYARELHVIVVRLEKRFNYSTPTHALASISLHSCHNKLRKRPRTNWTLSSLKQNLNPLHSCHAPTVPLPWHHERPAAHLVQDHSTFLLFILLGANWQVASYGR